MLFSDIPLTIVVPILAMTGAVLIELVLPIDQRPIHRRKGILFQGAFLILSPFVALSFAKLWSIYGLHILPPLESWAGVMAVPLLFVLTDFLAYWEHRIEHRFFWRVHKVHHSPEEIHAANTFGHPLQMIPTALFIGIPLSFLNAGTLPAWVMLASTFWVYYIQSPTRLHLSKLDWLLVDNRFHRIHHSLEQAHFDRNFAIVFPIWDRLFGTAFEPRPGEWPKVGIDEPGPSSLEHYLLMPFGSGASGTVVAADGDGARGEMKKAGGKD